jgi:hypothetical protein
VFPKHQVFCGVASQLSFWSRVCESSSKYPLIWSSSSSARVEHGVVLAPSELKSLVHSPMCIVQPVVIRPTITFDLHQRGPKPSVKGLLEYVYTFHSRSHSPSLLQFESDNNSTYGAINSLLWTRNSFLDVQSQPNLCDLTSTRRSKSRQISL